MTGVLWLKLSWAVEKKAIGTVDKVKGRKAIGTAGEVKERG